MSYGEQDSPLQQGIFRPPMSIAPSLQSPGLGIWEMRSEERGAVWGALGSRLRGKDQGWYRRLYRAQGPEMVTKAGKELRGRNRPLGGRDHTQTPHHKPENCNAERHGDSSKVLQTRDLIPALKVNCMLRNDSSFPRVPLRAQDSTISPFPSHQPTPFQRSQNMSPARAVKIRVIIIF